ncbi:MAG: hypothetical protein RL338_358 [Chloroflexota bacterium]
MCARGATDANRRTTTEPLTPTPTTNGAPRGATRRPVDGTIVVASVGIGLGFAYLVVAGGYAGTVDPRLRVLSLVLTAAVATGWLVAALARPALRPRSTLMPGIAASLGALAVATALAPNPRLGIEHVAWAVLVATLYLGLVRLAADDRLRPRLAVAVTVGGLVVAVAYLVVVASDWVALWSLAGRVTTPPLRPAASHLGLGNASGVTMLTLLVLLPAAIRYGASRRALPVVLLAIAGMVTVASGSRSAWLALPVTVAVLLAVRGRLADRRPASIPRARPVRPVAAIAALGALALLVVAATLLGPAILGRLTSGGESLRVGHWLVALRMAAESPVLGHGPGSWAASRIRYTVAPEADHYVPHAHDLLLQVLAELGLVGAAAGAILVLLVGRLIVAALRDADPARRRDGWAALATTVYFVAHSMLDLYLTTPSILLAAALPVALLDARAGVRSGRVEPSPAGRTPGRRFADRRATVACLALVVVAAGSLGAAESTALTALRATVAVNEGRADEGLRLAREAAAADPAMPAHDLILGLAAARAGDMDLAASALERAAAADDLPTAWLDVAALRLGRADRAGAAVALERALRLGDQQPAVRLGAAAIALELGDRDAAVEHLAAVVAAAPTIAADGPVAEQLGLGPAWDAALARAAGASPAVGAAIALARGDPALAAALATAIDDPRGRRTMRLLAAGWTGDGPAAEALAAAVAADPLDLGLVAAAATLAARRGDDAALARYDRWAGILGGGGIGFEVRLARPREGSAPAGGPPPGQTGAFHGHYAYRRQTPWDQLVPLVPRLVLRAIPPAGPPAPPTP